MAYKKDINTAIYIALMLVLLPAAGFAWDPPAGIPTPSWPAGGIDQARPVLPNPWSSEQAGFYYVNVSGCSDSRPYGYPGSPRCSIPGSPAAGAKIVIDGAVSGNKSISFSGTSGSPIWIMGYNTNSKPQLTGAWGVNGSYLIFDSLHWNATNLSDINLVSEGNYNLFRNCLFRNTFGSGYGAGIGAGGTNLIFYRVTVYDQGNWQSSTDVDRHGFKVYGGGDIWIVDSDIFHCQGDGVQVGDQNNASGAINKVYVGRNMAYENLQSCFWTKNATDVIFSENTCHDITFSNGGIGQGMGGQYDPKYVWFLFNTIYKTKSGIHMAGASNGGGGPWYAIGNVIYNVSNGEGCNEYDYGALGYRNDGGFYAFHNTIYDVDSFLALAPSGGSVVVKDNIFASKKAGSCPAIDSPAKAPTLDYNLYTTATQNVEYNGSTYASINSFASATGQEAHRQVGNPMFTGATNDFSLNTGSLAVATANQAVETGYTEFSTRYGRSIQFDITGTPRPQDKWEIGAFEFGSSLKTPAIPTGLRIVP